MKIPKSKNRKFIIKFRSMEEILLSENAFFDNYGNLTCANHYDNRQPDDNQLAPSYFHLLGKMKEFPQETHFPRWIIESEYEDIFTPNMALRVIASGKLSKEDAEDVAKQAVVIP